MDENAKQVLIRKRGSLKAILTASEKFCDSLTIDSVERFVALCTKFDRVRTELLSKFTEVQDQIEQFDEDYDEREMFENRYDLLIGRFKALIAQNSQFQPATAERNDSNSNSLATGVHHLNIRLPDIQLPLFSGLFEDWIKFRDSFQALIINRPELPGISKFYYLNGAVSGEAKALLENLPVSESNFEVAWSLLCQRYNNTRLIAQNHVRALFNLPRVDISSAKSLRGLIDHFSANINALKALDLNGVPIQDLLLQHMLLSLLDKDILKDWEFAMSSNRVSTLDQLLSFLESRCKVLELTTSCAPASNPKAATKAVTATVASVTDCCPLCKAAHLLFACERFRKLSIDERWNFVKANRLCFNCIKPYSASHPCSKRHCTSCSARHHSLLHRAGAASTSSQQRNASLAAQNSTTARPLLVGNTQPSASVNTLNSLVHSPRVSTLLPTAQIKVKNVSGNYVLCNALLDSGSDCHLITAHLAEQLQAPTAVSSVSIGGVNSQRSIASEIVHLEIASRTGNWRHDITCIIVDKITTPLPSSVIDTSNWNVPPGIDFADPNWNNSKPIQILLGADVFFKVLHRTKLTRSPHYPVIQDTALGCVVAGNFPSLATGPQTNHHVTSATVVSKFRVQEQLEKFWNIEELHDRICTPEEVACEQNFVTTTTRNPEGRYMVRLPRKIDHKELGISRNMALKRFLSLERRFSREPDLRHDYVEFMKEYKALDHMQIASSCPVGESYYIPHHPILKLSSTTTKLRVVFDASAVSSTGVSLNDTLMVGPCVQQDLFAITLRFRTHPIAFAADLAKMYRQVLIHPDDYDLQRIFWRNSPAEPLSEYQLKTVTYGTAPASFLATRALNQLVEDEGQFFPRASSVISSDFYVDDCISGCETEEEAISVYHDLNNLLSRGGFQLRKWSSNSRSLLQVIPSSDRETHQLRGFGDSNESVVKTLGLFWQPEDDKFHIQSPTLVDISKFKFTKRTLLSAIASIFDPLGLIAPIVINCKVLFQSLWTARLDWDDELPTHILSVWLNIYQDLPAISTISIPRFVRCIGIPNAIELHGFCDSSERAYGACFYLWSRDVTGQVTTRLLCAKSRVAPVKKLTMPRLELCAAVLLAKLLLKVQASLNLTLDSVNLWSDSTITLAWIATSPQKLKTFVANRVAEIQANTSHCSWRHVASRDNPADLISRGTIPSQLESNTLWWYGPAWIINASHTEQPNCSLPVSDDLPERKVCHVTLAETTFDEHLFQRHSSYLAILRIVAFCRRFVHNCRSVSKLVGPLTSKEIDDALLTCVKITQSTHYRSELTALLNGQPVQTKSHVVDLNPFIHSDGVLRVGGRLHNSDLPFQAKHQMILPPNHFTRKLVRDTHVRLLHGGINLIIADIRQRFWVPSLRRLVRNVVRSCITCFRVAAQPLKQIMGNLPAVRVQPAHPFLNVGVDYAGPYTIRHGGPRSKCTTKAYLAVFVCMATKAAHIEIVTSLSTPAFISAFTRFYCRRGIPSQVFSDNGTNFQGANRELGELASLLASPSLQQYVEKSASQLSVQWHFMPPRAPHFGGLWEACVKSMKFHLRRTISGQLLTFEELATVVAQVEAVLNSRPIAPLSEDHSEFSFLSPGHFLIGRALTALPTPDLCDVPMTRLSRWQHLQRAAALLWKRWSSDYLQNLQRRSKWKSDCPNLERGTLVLLKDDDLAPLQWRLALVHETHPGSDGRVRVVTLRTARGFVKRSISRLCPLPVESSSKSCNKLTPEPAD